MENNIKNAYSEVSVILTLMESKYIEKIPIKFRELINNERNMDYNPVINCNVPLTEQNLQRETLVILAMLNLNYWCESEDEKKELIAIYAENDRKKEKELREKYNSDNLFKNRKKIQPQQEMEQNMVLVKYEESNFIKKVLNKIMSFFRKK